MDFEITPLNEQTNRVRLLGRLDAPGAGQIELRLTAGVVPGGKDAVFDLSGVTFLASMGLRLFMMTARAMRAKGTKLALYGATAEVQGVLDLAAMHQMVPVTATEAEALARLEG